MSALSKVGSIGSKLVSTLTKPISREIPTAAEQVKGALELVQPDLARRKFIQQTAGLAARQAIPESVMSAAASITPEVVKAVAPKVVAKAVQKAAVDDSLGGALAAAKARIAKANQIVSEQKKALQQLSPEEAAKIKLGDELQELPAWSAYGDVDDGLLDIDDFNITRDFMSTLTHSGKYSLDELVDLESEYGPRYIRELALEGLPSRRLKTGWKSNPYLEVTDIPGVGAHVTVPSERDAVTSLIRANNNGNVHDDEILHEFLSTMQDMGVE